jgi:DNA-directed RNA polymerase subunit RPC12/RpoP
MTKEPEQCHRCGKLVVYQANEDGTFCPECGWSRAAAERFAKQHPFRFRSAGARRFVRRIRLILAVPAGLVGYCTGLFGSIMYSYLKYPYLQEEGVVWYREVLLNPGKLGWAHSVTTFCALFLTVLVAPGSSRSIILGVGTVLLLIVLPLVGFILEWAQVDAPLKLFGLAWLWRAFGAGLAWAFAEKLLKAKNDFADN